MNRTKSIQAAWDILDEINAENEQMLTNAFATVANGEKIQSPPPAKVKLMKILVTRLYSKVKSFDEWHDIDIEKGKSLFQYACESGVILDKTSKILQNDPTLKTRPKGYLQALRQTLEDQQKTTPSIEEFAPTLKPGAQKQQAEMAQMLMIIDDAISSVDNAPIPPWMNN